MNKVMNIGLKVQTSDGEIGTITDRMYSEIKKEYYYTVKLEDADFETCILCKADELQEFQDRSNGNYIAQAEILDNICIAVVYKVDGVNKEEISRGHGHIIHEGEIGVLQALSYAFKKAYDKITNVNKN